MLPIQSNRKHKGLLKAGWLALMALLFSPAVWAAGPPQPSSIHDPLVIALVVIMLFLLIAIALLANVLLGVARYQQESESRKSGTGGLTAVVLIGLLLCSIPGMAQDATAATAAATAPAAASSFGGLSSTAFYFMTGVILVEVIVIITLLAQLRSMIAREKERRVAEAIASGAVVAAEAKPKVSWWDRFNKFKPVEQEADLDLGHDYDGIRELDNRLPPWWLWGFYITIIFAVVYLWRFHVSHSGPSSAEEYAISVKKAEEAQKEYLKHAANLVDENNVKLLTDASDISAGKTIFEQNCKPCHGANGEGGVGPNLTDDYWLHGGSIHDVFKTIKYGWQDKGMKSWKDDLTPSQIAQVASFVKSLHGTNPPNAKPPQGDLYKDVPAGSGTDSSSAPAATSTAALQLK